MPKLTHFQRKLCTVINHYNKRGRNVLLSELELRLGHSKQDIEDTIYMLKQVGLLKIKDNQLCLTVKLF